MTLKPTREEVKELQACLEEYKHNAPWREYTLNLCKAYLAQEGELEEKLEEKDNDIKFLDKEIKRLKLEHEAILDVQRERFRQDKDQIEAENKALREALEGLDSLERYTHLYEDQ